MIIEGTMNKVEKIEKAIKEARASILLDSLPLSDDYVANYKKERINEIKNTKVLKLKRGSINGKAR